jgi:hypothetical protein
MQTLVLALYAEGSTDERFLPPVIQRTVQHIVAERGRAVVDVLEPLLVPKNPDISGQAEHILDAARQTTGYHALIIHADADHPTAERALTERFQPGLLLVEQAGIDHHLIPLIPVQMIEAWLLADPEALRQVIGTDMSTRDLHLPVQAHQVESDPDPKQTLKDVVQRATAQRRRRRAIRVSDMFAPLARTISLERLRSVPAYQQFVTDMSAALSELQIIE